MSDFTEKMLQDTWARERAHALTPRCNGGFPIGDDHARYHSRACDEATAALREAFERGKADAREFAVDGFVEGESHETVLNSQHFADAMQALTARRAYSKSECAMLIAEQAYARERGKAEQDKAVAEAYRKGWKRCHTLFVARLENPDDALVEAVFNADRAVGGGWNMAARNICRALARTLTEGKESNDGD